MAIIPKIVLNVTIIKKQIENKHTKGLIFQFIALLNL